MRCRDGALISLERGETLPVRARSAWELIGERGALQLDMLPHDGAVLRLTEHDPEQGVREQILWRGDDADWTPITQGPLHDFATAIRERRPPRCSLEQALICQRIADAIVCSAEHGRSVSIGDLPSNQETACATPSCPSPVPQRVPTS